VKFKIEKSEFLKLISPAYRVSSTKGVNTFTRSVIKLQIESSLLRISATDVDLTVETSSEVSSNESGVTVVPSRLLIDVVRSLPESVVEVSQEEEYLVISADRANFKLQTYDEQIFNLKIKIGDDKVAVPAEGLKEAINQVIKSASDDEIRPVLTGTLISVEDVGMKFVATDSYRLSLRVLSGLKPFQQGTSVLVPAKSLSEVEKIITSNQETKEVNIELNDQSAIFEIGNTLLSTRLINETFPDYNRLIPNSIGMVINTNKNELSEALRRMRLLISDPTSSVKFAPEADNLILSVNIPDVGKAEEQIEAECTGDLTPVHYSPNYLLDGIDSIKNDRIVIEVADTSNPSLVHGKDDSDFLYLLMPVRVV
jgi:DNA polymerase-3 subunit beta